MDRLACFKCEKEIKLLHEDNDNLKSLPLVNDAGLAKLEFGFGSKFDLGCTGYTDALEHVYGGDLLEVLASNSVYAIICDECFENNYKKLLAYRKVVRTELKRIQ